MRDTETAMAATEDFGKRKSLRKPAETFVSWKKTTAVEEQGRNISAAEQESSGGGKGRGQATSPVTVSGRSPHVLLCTNASSGKENSRETSGFVGREGRQSIGSSKFSKSGGGTRGNEEASRPSSTASVGGRLSTHGGQGNSAPTDCNTKSASSVALRSVPAEIFNRTRERRFAVLNGMRMREASDIAGAEVVEGQSDSQQERTLKCSEIGSEKEYEYGGKGTWHPSREDDEDRSYEHDEECGEEEIQSSQPRKEASMHAVGFFTGARNENGMSDQENDEDGAEVGEDADADDDEDAEDLQYPSEAMRKKERRQERAWLEKEGKKWKKKGLPRNFLLVDEQTKMLYGVGVGDWRKELMLLSRDLDPTIGNINRQPDGAVAEIAEWIQHTWEYNSPVKFKYIKEVIARGVTLRRVDLWKRIRNGESKPDGMSDRTWCTLERQLENPASIMKSENCRRANASRVNFDRTGPSGEVGVRKRLRRILRRSPDPDEIRVEMARDKGYGGRTRGKKDNSNVMLGSGGLRQLTMDVPRISVPQRNSNKQGSGEDHEEDSLRNEGGKFSVEDHALEDSEEQGRGSTLSLLSTEQILQHPFLAMMMRRLETLESSGRNGVLGDRPASIDEVGSIGDEEHKLGGVDIRQDSEDDERALEAEGREVNCTSGKQRKRGKQSC